MLSRHVIHHVGTLLVAACLPAVTLAQSPGVAWRTNLDQAKMEAAQSNRLLLLHFTTSKCGPCRLLDQNVFSQPHVGPAIEQDYVPVRIDADASPALAEMYRIRNVPTEIIATPQGQVLADPPIPDKADPYLAQLQNIARHFRQSAGAAQPASSANVNSAYAALPVPPRSSGLSAGQTPPATGPQVINNPAAQPTQQSQPQSQQNPFVNAAPNPGVYGQAQNVYAPPQQASPPQAAPPMQQQAAEKQQAGAADQLLAAQSPAMPTNAMPRSYRPMPETTAAATAAPSTAIAAPTSAVAMAATSANPSVTTPTPGASMAPAVAAGAATAALAAAPKPEKLALPAGSPPLAFDGYCPVTLKTLNRWTEGDRQFGAIHRGRTYNFAGAEQRDQFLANPDAFSPVFAGLDPVLLIDKQQSVEGSRALGFRYGDSFYLFSSEETKQKFAASPHTYAAGVRQAMHRIDAGGTVRR